VLDGGLVSVTDQGVGVNIDKQKSLNNGLLMADCLFARVERLMIINYFGEQFFAGDIIVYDGAVALVKTANYP
jgi:hypothetical protein